MQTAGIKDIKLPIKVMQKDGHIQDTVATISLSVELPAAILPRHVDQFAELLNRHIDKISAAVFPELLAEVQTLYQAQSARIDMSFPYYLQKHAPVSQTPSLMEYSCCFSGSIGADEGFVLTVVVPVMTLCPCSKEISEAGAHNQRAEVTMQVRFKKMIWVEDLIALIEECGSGELYALLKRPDEKYITETAYKNPMFVEDVVRKVSEKALAHPHITWFSVGVESFESIHNHSAYAYVDRNDIHDDGSNTMKS
jgi:GTP cyclohydrolase I